MTIPTWEQQKDGISALDVIDVTYNEMLDAHVRIEDWAKDHYSLLLYCESVAVDRQGIIALTKMRTNPWTHSDLAWKALDGTFPAARRGAFDYPTHVRPGAHVDRDHDDWDCLVDLRHAGMLTFEVLNRGTSNVRSEHIRVKLTEKGQRFAAAARAAVSNGARLSDLWIAAVIARAVQDACARA